MRMPKTLIDAAVQLASASFPPRTPSANASMSESSLM